MALITKENARSLAAKSLSSRIARRKRDLERLALVDQLLAKAAETPVLTPAPAQPTKDEFVSRRLARVRDQIERLSDMLDSEQDPQKLDRISAAIERMSKIEQHLAGRPNTGSLRPSSPPSNTRQTAPIISAPRAPTAPSSPTEQITPPIHAVKGMQGVSKGDFSPPSQQQSALPDKAKTSSPRQDPTPTIVPLPAGGPASVPPPAHVPKPLDI